MKRWPVLSVFLWAAAAALAADPAVSELAPPESKLAVGFNVRALIDTPLIKSLAGQQGDLLASMTAMHALPGFNPLRDVDRVLILSPSMGSDSPVLGILRGRFDVERLAHGARRHGGVPIVVNGQRGGQQDDVAIGLIDGETAVVGKLAQVEAAIDRRGCGAHLDAGLAARIDDAWAHYDFWGMEDSPGGLAANYNTNDPLDVFDRFWLGGTLRQGLELTAEVHPVATVDGGKMALALSTIEASLRKQQPRADGVRFEMHAADGVYRIGMAVPEAELRKAMDARGGTLAKAMPRGMPATRPSAAQVLGALALAMPAAIGAPSQPPAAARVLPRVPPKPPAKTRIVNSPDGDTMYVTLPGAR